MRRRAASALGIADHQCARYLPIDGNGWAPRLRRMRLPATALALSFILAGCGDVTVEQPKFTTVLKDGPFEIRDYPALTVAEVTVPGGQWRAANSGFRLLASYIFGGNARRQSIPMTAPVVQERIGQTIPMTAPVTQTQGPEGWVIRFIMPAGSTPETLPTPNDNQVRLAVSPPVREAVLRFSGWALSGSVDARTRELRAWIGLRRLQPTGPATLAQYDPPWTLWFLRRNELMIPVSD